MTQAGKTDVKRFRSIGIGVLALLVFMLFAGGPARALGGEFSVEMARGRLEDRRSPYVFYRETRLILNLKTAEKMGREIPPEILETAEVVTQ